MRIEEAIQELKEDKALYESDITWAGDGTPDGDLLLALDMAISALEKQIPKKPVYENKFGDCVVYSCPACKDKKLILDGDNYCTVCGQALDWSDEK